MRIALSLMLVFSFVGDVQGAEIRERPKAKGGQHIGVFAIEGDIEPGDSAKFEQVLHSFGHAYNDVHLASRGGDLREAMKIGRLIRKLRLSTMAPYRIYDQPIYSFAVADPANDVCASACFFMFIAGVERSGNIIGIHRPFLSRSDYEKIDVDGAFQAHDQARRLVSDYFAEMGVSDTYVDRLFAISKDEVEWLDEDEIDRFFYGFVPEIDEWLDAQCPEKPTEIEEATADALRRKMSPHEVGATPWAGLRADEKRIFQAIWDKERAWHTCRDTVHHRITCSAWYEHFDMDRRERERHDGLVKLRVKSSTSVLKPVCQRWDKGS